MIVIFPCNPLNTNEFDPDFLNEYNSAITLGFNVVFYNHDALVKAEPFVNLEKRQNNITTIFRGYMLKEAQYHSLYTRLLDLGYKLINNVEQYKNCHYFPKSYELVKEFSNEIWFSEDIDNEWIKSISELNTNLIIKDYVKSEKGTDLFLIESPITREDLKAKILAFTEQRGNLFNKGIQFKRFEELKQYDGVINEWRFFILNGKLISMSQNSNLQIDTDKPNLPNIKDIIDRLSTISNFFTFDIVEKNNGSFIIIETGDGSVSGLSPNQNELLFWSKIKEILS